MNKGNRYKGPERINTVLAQQARRARNIERLQAITARMALNTTREKLIGPGREEPRVTYRQMAMALARELTGATLEEIAAAFHVKDHNTVRHALAVISEKERADHDLKTLAAEIRALYSTQNAAAA